MTTKPMKALQTGAATTMSFLSEVATPVYAFILAAATAWRGGDSKIFKSTFSTRLG